MTIKHRKQWSFNLHKSIGRYRYIHLYIIMYFFLVNNGDFVGRFSIAFSQYCDVGLTMLQTLQHSC